MANKINLSAIFMTLLTINSATQAAVFTYNATGVDAAAILPTVTQFRSDMGGANNGVNASAGTTGRREINWDAVPNGFTVSNTLPGNFFNQNSQRGLQLSGGGATFVVSDNPVGSPLGSNSLGIEFDNFNGTYSTEFTTFSANKLFGTLNSSTYDLTFFVPLTGPVLPGSNPATVQGFGMVLTDVDFAGLSQIELFDINNNLLGTVQAGVADKGLSFIAFRVDGATPRIARVHVTQGSGGLGPNDSSVFDAVVADDFIYGEPVAATATPEPATCGLIGVGLALMVARQRRT